MSGQPYFALYGRFWGSCAVYAANDDRRLPIANQSRSDDISGGPRLGSFGLCGSPANLKIGPFLRSPHLGVKVAPNAEFSPGQCPSCKNRPFRSGRFSLLNPVATGPFFYISSPMPSWGQNIAHQGAGGSPGGPEMIETKTDAVMDSA